MVLLLEPIKHDLRLSDTQLGFLTGLAFALFFAFTSIPIARLADHHDRVKISGIAIGVWGLTGIACLSVSSFSQLIAARMLAAIGGAGCKPSGYSLVGDYFPEPGSRTKAMSIYMMGGPLAALYSFFVGGYLNQYFGWRMTFFLMGIPGLLLAVIVIGTVKEPRLRVDYDPIAAERPSLRSVITTLWNVRSLRHITAALILVYMMNLGFAPWYGAFLTRAYHVRTPELGLWLGLIFSLGGIVGLGLAGIFAGRHPLHSDVSQLRLGGLTVCLLVPCFFGFLLTPSKTFAFLSLIPIMVILHAYMGPTFAILQRLVDVNVRATMLAVILTLANIVGMGLGPQIVGILSDVMHPQFGPDSLRYAILAVSLVALWAGYHFIAAARTVALDLKRAEAGNSATVGQNQSALLASEMQHSEF